MDKETKLFIAVVAFYLSLYPIISFFESIEIMIIRALY